MTGSAIGGCLDADTAAVYLMGTLMADEVERVDLHIDDCVSCRRFLSELARLSPDDAGLPLPSVGDATPVSGGELPLVSGDRVGRYVIESVLGVGGMGVVYAARDPELDRAVALKRVRSDLAKSEATQNRLLREAQAMARLSHPNVVTVYDLVVHHQHLFIAMELVVGVSLRRWLAEERRPWRAILDSFLAAGRGLAAAHAVNLVHRDFKAENVLRDANGRVRVTDFGLSRLNVTDSEEEAAPVSRGAASSMGMRVADGAPPSSTRAGTILGTPGYMAPELLGGGRADARSDQFSYCVALYEALYGARPFLGTSIDERLQAIREQRVAPERSDSSVPRWLRTALLVGLRADPAQRHPSLAALLAALEPRVPQRRLGLLVLAAFVALVGASAGVILSRSWESRAAVRACDASGDELTDTWNERRASAVHAAFIASKSTFAEYTFESVRRALDEYAAAWRRERVEACQSTRVTKTQSEQILALRVQCLAHHREGLHELTLALGAADPLTVKDALASADALAPNERCAGDRVVREPATVPLAPAAQAEAEELRRSFALVMTLASTGHASAALAQATTAEEASARLGDPVLEGEALWALGRVQEEAEDFSTAGKTLHRAVDVAERIRDDGLLVDATTSMARVLVHSNAPYERTDDWASRSELAIERLGGDVTREVAVLDVRSSGLLRGGRYDEGLSVVDHEIDVLRSMTSPVRLGIAAALRRRALLLRNLGRTGEGLSVIAEAAALQSGELGPTHPEVMRTERIWGDILVTVGKYPEAIEHLTRAREVILATPTVSRHDLVDTLNSLGAAYESDGDYQKALTTFEDSGRIAEEAFGPDDRAVGRSYSNRSLAYLDLNRPKDAISAEQKALVIWRRLGAEHPDVANAECALGEIMLADGRPTEAIEMLRHALGVYERTLGEDTPRVAATLATLGEALIETHKAREAIVLLERALRIEKERPDNPLYEPWTDAMLGRALLLSGGDRVRAHQLITNALASLTALGARGEGLASRIHGWHL